MAEGDGRRPEWTCGSCCRSGPAVSNRTARTTCRRCGLAKKRRKPELTYYDAGNDRILDPERLRFELGRVECLEKRFGLQSKPIKDGQFQDLACRRRQLDEEMVALERQKAGIREHADTIAKIMQKGRGLGGRHVRRQVFRDRPSGDKEARINKRAQDSTAAAAKAAQAAGAERRISSQKRLTAEEQRRRQRRGGAESRHSENGHQRRGPESRSLGSAAKAKLSTAEPVEAQSRLAPTRGAAASNDAAAGTCQFGAGQGGSRMDYSIASSDLLRRIEGRAALEGPPSSRSAARPQFRAHGRAIGRGWLAAPAAFPAEGPEGSLLAPTPSEVARACAEADSLELDMSGEEDCHADRGEPPRINWGAPNLDGGGDRQRRAQEAGAPNSLPARQKRHELREWIRSSSEVGGNQAAKAFGASAGLGADHFNPRQLAPVSAELVEVRISFGTATEAVGTLPEAATRPAIVTLAKKGGGRRASGRSAALSFLAPDAARDDPLFQRVSRPAGAWAQAPQSAAKLADRRATASALLGAKEELGHRRAESMAGSGPAGAALPARPRIGWSTGPARAIRGDGGSKLGTMKCAFCTLKVAVEQRVAVSPLREAAGHHKGLDDVAGRGGAIDSARMRAAGEGWLGSGFHVEEPRAELRIEFWRLIEGHGGQNISTIKVKALCAEHDVREVRISDRQRAGNARADKRAKEGTHPHGVAQGRLDRIATADDLATPEATQAGDALLRAADCFNAMGWKRSAAPDLGAGGRKRTARTRAQTEAERPLELPEFLKKEMELELKAPPRKDVDAGEAVATELVVEAHSPRDQAMEPLATVARPPGGAYAETNGGVQYHPSPRGEDPARAVDVVDYRSEIIIVRRPVVGVDANGRGALLKQQVPDDVMIVDPEPEDKYLADGLESLNQLMSSLWDALPKVGGHVPGDPEPHHSGQEAHGAACAARRQGHPLHGGACAAAGALAEPGHRRDLWPAAAWRGDPGEDVRGLRPEQRGHRQDRADLRGGAAAAGARHVPGPPVGRVRGRARGLPAPGGRWPAEAVVVRAAAAGGAHARPVDGRRGRGARLQLGAAAVRGPGRERRRLRLGRHLRRAAARRPVLPRGAGPHRGRPFWGRGGAAGARLAAAPVERRRRRQAPLVPRGRAWRGHLLGRPAPPRRPGAGPPHGRDRGEPVVDRGARHLDGHCRDRERTCLHRLRPDFRDPGRHDAGVPRRRGGLLGRAASAAGTAAGRGAGDARRVERGAASARGGLVLEAASGVVWGLPNQAAAGSRYRVLARDADGREATAVLEFEVLRGPGAPEGAVAAAPAGPAAPSSPKGGYLRLAALEDDQEQ
ncbi:unnamed protein product [Prorocentrum cordatum]|uniref:Uncharacterized protein n=1 Tax=Prorocentrum cordatum TaxID=2364126 RepID=A0ABN9QWF5_9DINO|nr:unnamed protein product [Polarella glacialis]